VKIEDEKKKIKKSKKKSKSKKSKKKETEARPEIETIPSKDEIDLQPEGEQLKADIVKEGVAEAEFTAIPHEKIVGE
ncbi:hypothetical protein T4B_12674, partial [Trichinella pseudospiralis]